MTRMAFNREDEASREYAEDAQLKRTSSKNKRPLQEPPKKTTTKVVPNFVKADSETSSEDSSQEDRAVTQNAGLRPAKMSNQENQLEQMMDQEKVFKTTEFKKKDKGNKQQQQQPQQMDCFTDD